MRNSATRFQRAQRHSRRVIFSTTQKYPKLIPPLAVRHENRQSQLLRYGKSKQTNNIFEYSPVERISRKQFIASHLQKFIPPVSAFMRVHPYVLHLTSKSFTLSRKKATIDRLLIGLFGQLCCFKSGEPSREIGFVKG